MPAYVYEAVDSRGQRVRSEIEALSEEEAQSKVRGLGCAVAFIVISLFLPLIKLMTNLSSQKGG